MAQVTIHGALVVNAHPMGVELVLPGYVAKDTTILLSRQQAEQLVDALDAVLGYYPPSKCRPPALGDE